MSDLIRPVVLVVDDDPSVREALSSLLASRIEPFYEVVAASSAEEAIELASEPGTGAVSRPLALVISDERMPGGSGTDLLVALRKNPMHRAAGRMIITGYAGLASAMRAINEAEVDRYFPKPWDTDGALLPAVGEVLWRFAEEIGLDCFLLAGATSSKPDEEAVLQVRRAWWDYVTLMGEPANESWMHHPSFRDPQDEGATRFLARRLSPRQDTPAGSLRLRPGRDAGPWLLDALAFIPEEASDELETLLVRTALVHASRHGISEVLAEPPAVRREVYERLGFKPATAGAPDVPGEAVWVKAPVESLPSAAFAARYFKEQRLCSCAQAGCAMRDYAADRRGYFCPLDLHEGRRPAGLPVGARR